MARTSGAAEALAVVRTFLKDFENYILHLERLAISGRAVERAASIVAESWSGSPAGYHGVLYYRDFQRPTIQSRFNVEWGGLRGIPGGWGEKSAEEVKRRMESITSEQGIEVDLDHLERETEQARLRLDRAPQELEIAFAPIAFLGPMEEREQELYRQLRDFTFSETRAKMIKARIPGFQTRDSRAAHEGLTLASHLYYEITGSQAVYLSDRAKELAWLAERLVRLLEARFMVLTGDGAGVSRLTSLHPEVYAKCHALYGSGAYAEAAEKSFKVVRDRLRTLTGFETGSDAFGKGHLFIRGGAAANVEQDFNDGVKFLAMAIDRFRNEKSHSSDAKIDDADRAFEYLSLSSLAMRLLDNAEIRVIR